MGRVLDLYIVKHLGSISSTTPGSPKHHQILELISLSTEQEYVLNTMGYGQEQPNISAIIYGPPSTDRMIPEQD